MLLSYHSSGQRKRSHHPRAIGLERVRRLRLTLETPNQPDSQALYARQGIVPNGQKRRCGRAHSDPEAREGGCDPVILGQNASLKDRAHLLAGIGVPHWCSEVGKTAIQWRRTKKRCLPRVRGKQLLQGKSEA